MTDNHEPFWRKASKVFHSRAAEYDQWFDDGNLLFQIELGALKQLQTDLGSPKLEIGVGPGRFAEALNVDYGVDPAHAPLVIAAGRNIASCRAVGEHLPVQQKKMGAVFLLFTLCFVENPTAVLQECYRVLKPDGHLIIGTVPSSSPWGRVLHVKKEQNHPFYQHARFYEVDIVRGWLDDYGFTVTEIRSTLMQSPDSLKAMEDSCEGLHGQAGFVVLVGGKKSEVIRN